MINNIYDRLVSHITSGRMIQIKRMLDGDKDYVIYISPDRGEMFLNEQGIKLVYIHEWGQNLTDVLTTSMDRVDKMVRRDCYESERT